MSPGEVIQVGQEALFVLLKVALPIMLISMGVGLLISLFQALTQIQEMTLSFVPKIIAVFISLAFLLPYMLDQLQTFAEFLNAKIVGLG